LISACPKAGCHAVLAFLSKRYPPLEGRSPTRYSPVCHSVTPCGVTAFDLHVLGTPPALILSQDQTLMLDGLPHAPRPPLRTRKTGTRSDSTNTRPVMALALSPMPTPSMFREAPTPGLLSSLDDWPRPTTPRRCYQREAIEPDRHPLILDGLAVTFYLVFKEPVLLVRPPSASQPSSVEPFKLTNPPSSCQALISAFPGFSSCRADNRPSRSWCVANPRPWSFRPWAGVASPAMPNCAAQSLAVSRT
jgi:hypothetical protein